MSSENLGQPTSNKMASGGRQPTDQPSYAGRSSSRRQFLHESSLGFGSLALSYLLASDGLLASERTSASSPEGASLRSRPPHFPAQANAVIVLLQNGGPSQMD